MSDSRDQVFPGPEGPSRLRRIVLEFESFRDFIQAFSPVVSEEGMFISAKQIPDGLPALGEEVNFEVALTDDFRLVHGRGEVAWIREPNDPEGEAGVAVRFLDLDEPSRRLVSRLLANYAKDGGRLFKLSLDGAGAGPTVEPEPLARSEADALFTVDADLLATEPELLDAIAPDVPEPPPPLLDPGVGQDELPTLELDIEQLKVGAEDLFESPDDPVEGLLMEDEPVDGLLMEDEPVDGLLTEEEPKTELSIDEVPGIDLAMPGLPDSEIAASPGTIDLGEPAAAGSPAVSEDVAQIAEELSEVHKVQPVEMPSEEDQISMAGAGQVSGERSAWRTPLLASVAGIALAVAVWYFAGDQVMSLVGLGGNGEGLAPVVAEGAPEAPTAIVPESQESRPDDGAAASDTGPETEPQEAASQAEEAEDTEDVTTSTLPIVEPPAQPAETVAQTSPGSPVSQIQRITWQVEDGQTVVSIVLDGEATDDICEVVRIRQGAPREVIKIQGVEKTFSPNQLDVDSGQLQGLRTGLHASSSGSEIHIVADLTGPAVAVTSVRTQGNTILITFS